MSDMIPEDNKRPPSPEYEHVLYRTGSLRRPHPFHEPLLRKREAARKRLMEMEESEVAVAEAVTHPYDKPEPWSPA